MKHTFRNILTLYIFVALTACPIALFANPEISIEQPIGTALTDGAATIGYGNVNAGSGSNGAQLVRKT